MDETILPKTNYNSPFYTAVPPLSQPTEVLSKRFELWRQVIKSLVNYFKAISVATNQYSMINNNIVDTISFPFFTSLNKTNIRGDIHEIKEPAVENTKKQSFFAPFGNGAIQDVQILLKKYHLNMAQQQIKIVHQLQTDIIPRLEELQRDLFTKIREIKGLNGDFKNNLKEDVALSGQCLDDYLTVVRGLDQGDEAVIQTKTDDPFLLRIKLELQLKQQLNQENYLEEAFINLQMTGLELEKIIFKEIQDALNKYSELMSQEIFVIYNDLINELHEGVISKKPYFEWDDFIERDDGRNFLKLIHDQEMPVPRKISTIQYPYSKHLISKSIRSGHFLKKSKILKNYSKSFFILTLNYLHEFKSSNLLENLTPVNSIKLNDCILTESTESKFQLHVKTSHSLKGHNYVFKRIPEEMSEHDFKKWITDLKSLTSFNTFTERMLFVSHRINSSNESTTSTSGTPRFEPSSGPLENMSEVTRKLQDIQNSYSAPKLGVGYTPYTHDNGSYKHLIPSSSNSQTPLKSPKQTPIQQPHENIIPRSKSPVLQQPSYAVSNTIRGSVPTASSGDPGALQRLSLDTLNVPSLEVQAPTPILPHEHTGILRNPVPNRPNNSHDNDDMRSLEMLRSATPAIGDLKEQIMENKHIDLGQRLYNGDESVPSPVDNPNLEKVMDAIRDGGSSL